MNNVNSTDRVGGGWGGNVAEATPQPSAAISIGDTASNSTANSASDSNENDGAIGKVPKLPKPAVSSTIESAIVKGRQLV